MADWLAPGCGPANFEKAREPAPRPPIVFPADGTLPTLFERELPLLAASRETALDRFGRPGKGNDRVKIEGLVGCARRNYMVPVPVFDSFAALNVHWLPAAPSL
jgi:hypothetical protein